MHAAFSHCLLRLSNVLSYTLAALHVPLYWSDYKCRAFIGLLYSLSTAFSDYFVSSVLVVFRLLIASRPRESSVCFVPPFTVVAIGSVRKSIWIHQFCRAPFSHPPLPRPTLRPHTTRRARPLPRMEGRVVSPLPEVRPCRAAHALSKPTSFIDPID